MHLNEGEIRAYQDQELDQDALQRVQTHLASCLRCQAQADQILARSQEARVKMALLKAESPRVFLPSAAARQRLDARSITTTKEYENMSKKWYTRIPRPMWAGILAVAILAIALTFAPVRAIANGFLGLFRVQQIQVVQVSPGNLQEQLGSSAQFEAMFSKDVRIQDQGQAQDVASTAEASNLAGITVRLPQSFQGQPVLSVQPGGNAEMAVNVEHVRALLAEIGRSDIEIPDSLDGAQISIQVPAGVLAEYGECQFDAEPVHQQGYNPDKQGTAHLTNCTTLLQMPSPTIQAPPGLDVEKIGEAYLQVMGMSQKEAEQFARNVDWASTVVIPVPSYSASYQEVPVDGVKGTLILKQSEGPAQYLLVWVKDGIVYALNGPGVASTALSIASSMQ
jgi:hypothetical protein